MKKTYLFLLTSIFVSTWFSVNAQVTGMPTGYITITPTVSTSAAPVWYNLMSTNTDVARINRYMYYDGTSLKTDVFNSPGITDALQHDKYLWRLEQGSGGAGYVVFVNKLSGKRLYADAAIASNGVLTMADNGVDWKMAASSALTTGTVAGQYCFNFEGSGLRYLNAGDGVTMAWAMLVFNGAGSPAKSSGWFFYPVTTTKTVSFAQSDNGTLAVTATNGTAVPATLATGNTVLVGTVANVTATAATGYKVNTLLVNGTDVTSQLINGVYSFPVNIDATVAVTFAVNTATNISLVAKSIDTPYISGTMLQITNRLNNSAVYVYDLCGNQIIVSTEMNVNTSSLMKGIYVVKYVTADGIHTAKIIKE